VPSPIDAFLEEVAATHRLCDSDPRITATDHVVLAMWEQLGTNARAHLLLRFARGAAGTLTDLSVAWDEAGEDAHWLHQATPAGTDLAEFADAEPGDAPGLTHQAARIALRLAADPETALRSQSRRIRDRTRSLTTTPMVSVKAEQAHPLRSVRAPGSVGSVRRGGDLGAGTGRQAGCGDLPAHAGSHGPCR
jgi:hypothetical protein